VAGGPRVQPAPLGHRDSGVTLGGAEVAGERPDRLAELGRAPQRVALPERQATRNAGRRRDQDPGVGDVLDPPAGRAQREDVADARLVDHLLVQLTDAAAGSVAAHEEDAEQAAVGDRAAARDREALRAGAAGELSRDAVPDDARAELGELVARVA